MSTKFNLKTIFNQGSRSRYSFLILVLLFTLTGFYPARALGNIYYVDKTNSSCDDAGTGLTPALPFCTISKGASVATFGDEVRVIRNYAPTATYVETVTVPNSGTAVNPIIFSAVSGVTVTGDNLSVNTSSAFRLLAKSYIVVDGFTIANTRSYGIYVSGSTAITISHNHVTNSGSDRPFSSSTTRAGIFFDNTSNSTITGNTTDHNSQDGITLRNGSSNNTVSDNVSFGNAEQWQRNATGIQVSGATSANNTIIHNIVYANEDTGLQFYTGTHNNIVVGNLSYGNGDHGIDNLNSPNNIAVGNTVQGNHTSGINFEGTVAPGSSSATIMDNISVDNGINPISGGQRSNIRVDSFSTAGTTMDYNLVYLSGAGTSEIIWNGINYATLAAFQAAGTGQEVHGIQADPLFVLPVAYATRPPAIVAGDYHIQTGSPAIDSANSGAPSEPALDLDGNPRVDDPATFPNTGVPVAADYFDRGAYEFQTGGVLPAVTTEAVTMIGATTATGNGTVTALGIPNPTQHGVVWGTAPNPTTANSRTSDGPVGATGPFTSAMTGLIPNTTYHVRAYAANATGTAYGTDVTFTTNLAAPIVTTNPASGVTTTAATLNGTVNANNASTTVTFEYGTTVAYGTTVTAAESPVTGVANTAVSFGLTGLTPNTLYHYRAVGVNSGGTTNGLDATFTTSAAAPTVTTNAASGVTTTAATLNGTVNANNASTTVTFEYGTTVAYGTTVTAAESPVTGVANTAVSFGLTGLTPNTLYHYRAVGVNGTGTTNGLDATFTTSAAAPTVTTNAASGVTTTAATLNGTVNANNASTTVTFEYGTTVAYGTTVTAAESPVTGVANTAVSFGLTGLTPNTLYHYRAVGVNSGGTTNGLDATFTTSAAAPTVTTNAASGVTTTAATLNGTVNANNASTTVTFEYGTTVSYGTTVTAAESPVTGVANTAVSFGLTGLTPNTLYHYRAVGVNGTGTTNGLDATFTTSAAAPTVTTNAASGVTTTAATLNGTVNANNASTTVTFEYGTTVAYGTTVTAAESPVTGVANTAVSFGLTGLTPNTLYHYRAVGVNGTGTTNGLDATFTTSAAAPTVTTNAASGVTTTAATLNGTVNANNASTTVTFEYGTTVAYGTTVTAAESPVTGVANTAVSFGLTGLTPNTLYHYRAVGVNSGGTTNGLDATFTTGTTAPTATTNAATVITATAATLNGTVNANNNSTTVTFEYGLTNTYGLTIPAMPNTVTGSLDTAVSAMLTGLTTNTIYHYRVVAVNGGGTANGVDLTFTTLGTTVTTTIHDNATDATITDGTIGMIVHDSATVVGTGVTPTGTVTFTYYDNPGCSGTGMGAGIISLEGFGVAHPSNAVTVTPNGLSFKATYNGDANYVSGTSACETLNTPPVVLTNGVEYNAVGNPLSEFQVFAVGVNKLLVTFNKNVQNLPATDPNYGSSVINPANYMLVNNNGNGFDDSPIVTSCITNINPNSGDDFKISVDTVTFSDGGGSGPFTATLNINNGQPLADGIYRLYVCGTTSITDLNGQKLAGNGSTAGTDFLRNFIVNISNGSGEGKGGGISTVKTLPATGFAPGMVSILPFQPAEKAYTSYGDLTLEISTLKLKASIIGVPEAQEGWDVTWLGNSAGWLNGTAFPTWNGNSVITGHVWDANNNPGIFVDLKKLKYGDQVKIHAWGQVYTYEVRKTHLVLPSSINTVMKHEDRAWVTLVTCEDFNLLFTKYSYRRVVRAILLSVVDEK